MAKDILNVGGFSIIKRIGTGARSTIYMATDEQDKTNVALKRVIFERPEDSRVFEQTETEYKVARRIDHPYVRKCYKLKKIRNMFKVKEMLLSMELFEGKTLEEGPTLSLVDVLLVFRGLAVPQPCRAPHELKKRIPIGISKLVMDCVEDKPAERPRNMMTVISRLDLMIHSIFGGKIKTNKNASNNN